MKKSRVLILRSNPVNPDSRVEKECAALTEAGYQVTIFAWDRESDHPLWSDTLMGTDVTVKRIGIRSEYSAGFRSNIGPLFRFQLSIAAFLMKQGKNFDIIHACDFDTAFAAYLCNFLMKKKFVYDIFDYYVDAFNVPSELRSLISYLDKRVIEAANLVILCTEERLKQIFPAKPKKNIILHNSPPDQYNPKKQRKGLDGGRISIVYVGILSPGRLIEELIHAVELDDRFVLHLAGFGSLEGVVKNAVKKNNRIIFHGKISYQETLLLESQADILTAIYDPSIRNHRYAAPNKFYESLMLGKPLIVAENTGIDELVNSQRLGVVIEYSFSGLRDGLSEMAEMLENESGKIEQNCREMYVKHYSWNIMARRLITAYEKVENES